MQERLCQGVERVGAADGTGADMVPRFVLEDPREVGWIVDRVVRDHATSVPQRISRKRSVDAQRVQTVVVASCVDHPEYLRTKTAAGLSGRWGRDAERQERRTQEHTR